MGLSEACYIPSALALIADDHDGRTRSLATGVHMSGIYAGIVLGGGPGGWFADAFGWRAAFTFLGVAGLAYAGVVAVFLRERSAPAFSPAKPPGRIGESLRALLAIKGFRTVTAVFTAMAIANWTVYTWLPLYLLERFQMGLANAGFTATFYIQAASFAGILAGGWVADRWSRSNPRGRLFMQAAGLAAMAAALMAVPAIGQALLLIVALIVFGLGRGVYECNAMPALAEIAPPQLRATGYGIFNFAGCVAGGLMAVMAGYLKPLFGLDNTIAVSGA